MIVTTGKHITIAVGSFRLCRTAETPGIVTVTHNRRQEPGAFILPTNAEESAQFIKAYQRIISEDVAYRDTDVE